MPRDLLHLLPGDGAVEIGRERRLNAGADLGVIASPSLRMTCMAKEGAELLGAVQRFGNDQSAQGGAAAGEPRLYRAEVDVEDLGDLFVGEAFDLAQDDDGAEGLGNLAQSGFDALADSRFERRCRRANCRRRPAWR